MIRKFFKWTGIVLLMLILIVSILTVIRQNTHYDAPYPNIHASKDSLIIATGKNLVFGPAHCADCHSKSNSDSLLSLGKEVPLSGGVLFDLPFGKIYTKNITSDKTTGIGKYKDEEIARALRYGVHPDGTVMYDFMPFHNMSDEDLTAVISYLRTVQPVSHKVPNHELNVMGNLVKAFLIKPVGPTGDVLTQIKKDTSADYGKYLAVNVANCNGCHTARDGVGRFVGEPFAGGTPMGPDPNLQLAPPNLTPDSSGRIFAWSQQDFINRFRQGKKISYSEMPWNSFKRMSDTELKAIYTFLRNVKPVKSKA
jgi:hypothetical protein